MRKSSVLILSIFCLTAFCAGAADITQLMEMYKTNQRKIKTMIALGRMNIQMIGSDDTIITEVTSDISIYVKYPDMFKLVITDPMQSITVQKGNTIIQKIGTGPAVTQAADIHNNLSGKFLAYDIGDVIDTSRILGQETIEIGGKPHYKFTIEIPESEISQQITPGTTTAEIVFNENGMIVRQILFADDVETVKSESVYTLKDSVHVIQQLTTMIKSEGMILVNTMTYNAVSINKEISDREFELK